VTTEFDVSASTVAAIISTDGVFIVVPSFVVFVVLAVRVIIRPAVKCVGA